jgi:hypothetical protein
MTVMRVAPLFLPPAEFGLAAGAALSWLDGLHLGSDFLIGLCYVAISATLVYLFQRSKGGIPFSWVVLAFATFIIGCGTTHFMHIALALNPNAWWGVALAQAVTLAASAATAVALPPLVPRALALIEADRLSEARQRQLEANHAGPRPHPSGEVRARP